MRKQEINQAKKQQPLNWKAVKYQFLKPSKLVLLGLGLLIVVSVFQLSKNIEIVNQINTIFDTIAKVFGFGKIYLLNYLLAGLVLLVVLYLFILPWDFNKFEKSIKDLRVTDNPDENSPKFLVNRRYKKSHIYEALFFSEGSIRDDFIKNDNMQRLGSKIGKFIVDVETFGKANEKMRILYRKTGNNKVVLWQNEYLSSKDFELALGQKPNRDILYADLNKNAHLLIAGSTGSGKSVLLSSLLMQGLLKGAKVEIAEFSKRGVDWAYWENLRNCEVHTSPKEFLEYFENKIVPEFESRANLIKSFNCKNISEYNSKIESGEIEGQKLERVIIALDEAGQVFITSKDKEREEILKPIRAILNNLVTTYRFCGIHLILATQIPSSQIFSQEIRYLTDLKMCGVSTKLLSEISIESEAASAIKQKGEFYTNNEDRFQGFLFREPEVLSKFQKG